MMTAGQDVNVTCNYSTSYPIPESAGYYLYDGIDLTINTHYRLTAAAIPLQGFLTRSRLHSFATLFRGHFGINTTNLCINLWQNRCSDITFDYQDTSCDPCHFSVTLSAYDSSIDDTEYVTNVATTTETEFCSIFVTGKKLKKHYFVHISFFILHHFYMGLT